jgi:hypothetical protein
VFEGIYAGEQFTNNELEKLKMHNVKITVQTINDNEKPID